MKKILAYILLYPILLLTYIFDAISDFFENLFGNKKRIEELEDRIDQLEGK